MTVFSLIPPAGHKIPLVDFLTATINYVFSRNNEGFFLEKLKAFLGVKYCYLVSSGTAALYIILKSLKHDTQQNEVIIPAYTCPSVAAAIVKSGLKVRLCDINKNDFNYDIESLKNTISPDTLCIVAVHLFGVYSEMQELKDLCVQKNIYIIEDAAQGFGNYVENTTTDGNKMLGTLGDVGFYSFGRGKPLNLMHGGAIVTNSEKIANKIKWVYAQLPESSFLTDIAVILKTFLYRLFFRPGLYWIPNSIPFLKLGETIFSLRFSITRMSRFTITLANSMLEKIDKFRLEREQISQKIITSLSNPHSAFRIPHLLRCALLRFPLIFERPEARDTIHSRLLSAGIGATGLYPVPLNKQEGVPEYLEHNGLYPNAEYVSKRILTLPTHSLVSDKDVAKMVDTISKEI